MQYFICRAERDRGKTDEHGFRAAHRTGRDGRKGICDPEIFSKAAMGPPVTAEKCYPALAEADSREGEAKRSGNTVKIPSSYGNKRAVFLRFGTGLCAKRDRGTCKKGHTKIQFGT